MVKYFDGFGKDVTGYVQTLEEENSELKMKVTVLEDTLSAIKSTPEKEKKKVE